MMTGCPHLRESQSPTMRGMPSAVPPGGNGTMIFTARLGKSCASARGDAIASTQTANAAAHHPNAHLVLVSRRLTVMRVSLHALDARYANNHGCPCFSRPSAGLTLRAFRDTLPLERNPAKWEPVRRKIARHIKDSRP